MEANVLSIDLPLEGKEKGKVEMPSVFEQEVRPDLIRRAVLAENTRALQPQAHYPLAGMQTTAAYYGRMHTFRTGRHMGQAIRPRQKLAHGIQGKVRIIPSAVKGKRAHPHLVEKTIIEEMNKKEYQKALASAISATTIQITPHVRMPVIVSDEIESISKTKEMLKKLTALKRYFANKEMDKKASIKKGLRRSTRQKHYKKSVLLVTANDCAAIRAARNIAGVDACTVSSITANLLAPGGNPGRPTIWSEQAIRDIEESVKKQNLS